MDMPRLFPIGEVAKLFNLSVSSLRHYDNTGLLSPEGEPICAVLEPRDGDIAWELVCFSTPRYRGFSEEPRR